MVIEIIAIYHRYLAKMGGNARMAMLTHEERSAQGRKPVRAKKSTSLSCDTNLEQRQSMAARVERSRTKSQQMEGTKLTPIQDMVVRVECYMQDLMQKKGLLLFNRRGTRRHFL